MLVLRRPCTEVVDWGEAFGHEQRLLSPGALQDLADTIRTALGGTG